MKIYLYKFYLRNILVGKCISCMKKSFIKYINMNVHVCLPDTEQLKSNFENCAP